MSQFSYGFEMTLRNVSRDEALRRVKEGLANEGFGVISEVNLQETFADRLGIAYRSYVILGTCNPRIAQAALAHDPHFGLLVPCNVVVQDTEQGDTLVSIADPKLMFSLVDVPALASVANEAQLRLQRVVDVLEQGAEAA